MELVKNDVVKNVVKNVLTKHIDTRDSDSHCYERVLECYGVSKNMRYTTLEKRIRDGILPSRDTVTRIRRKVQEENPTLRGNLWEPRHSYAKVVAKSL